jgi:hypothetical protein
MIDVPISNKWAQVGWLKRSNGTRNDFYQVVDSANGIFVDHRSLPAQPVLAYTYYTVLNTNILGKFSFQINGVELGPLHRVNATFAPTRGQIISEIRNYANKCQGPRRTTG